MYIIKKDRLSKYAIVCKYMIDIFWQYFRVVDQIFQCIIDKIESEFGVTCSGKDKELAILSYGPTLQSSLSLSFAPTKCRLYQIFQRLLLE